MIMRSFARPTSLDRLSLEARIVYTAFCVFMLLGYASSVWLYLDDDLGASSASAQRYFLGEKSEPKKEEATAEDGPSLDLPVEQEPALEGLRLEKPPRQVMETLHFHLFSVPVCLLIISHIFMMTGLSTKTKAIVIATASVATLVHLATPSLIRFVSEGFSFLMFPSALAMGATWVYMTSQPIVQMWLSPKASKAGQEAR